MLLRMHTLYSNGSSCRCMALLRAGVSGGLILVSVYASCIFALQLYLRGCNRCDCVAEGWVGGAAALCHFVTFFFWAAPEKICLVCSWQLHRSACALLHSRSLRAGFPTRSDATWGLSSPQQAPVSGTCAPVRLVSRSSSCA